jgi:hypothetical protein
MMAVSQTSNFNMTEVQEVAYKYRGVVIAENKQIFHVKSHNKGKKSSTKSSPILFS